MAYNPSEEARRMPENDTRAEETENARISAASEEVPDAEIVDERPELPQSSPPSPTTMSPRRGGTGFWGGLLGGVLAVAAGFGLAQYLPGLWPVADTSTLQNLISQQAQEIEKLKSDLGALAAKPIPDPSAELATLRAGLEEKLAESSAAADPSAAIASATQALQSSITSIDARLTDLEKRPVGSGGGVSDAALAAYDRELQALRDQISSQSASSTDATALIANATADAKTQLEAAVEQAKQASAEAAASAQKLATGAALSRVAAAIEGGGPYASAVAELTAAGLTVPPEIASASEQGLPTLSDLQRRFPDAARAALDAALRSQVGESWTDRVSAFLRTQTGVRSLEPREGNDPDAVLSRAEAFLQNGDLAQTLTEIAALPESAQTAMVGWVKGAQARLAATQALATLTTAADAQ